MKACTPSITLLCVRYLSGLWCSVPLWSCPSKCQIADPVPHSSKTGKKSPHMAYHLPKRPSEASYHFQSLQRSNNSAVAQTATEKLHPSPRHLTSWPQNPEPNYLANRFKLGVLTDTESQAARKWLPDKGRGGCKRGPAGLLLICWFF